MSVPVDLGRDEAQRRAADELAKPEYQADRPGLLERALGWFLDRLGELFAQGTGSPRGWLLGLVVAGLLVTLAVAVLRRVRPGARARTRTLFAGRVRSAAEHRAAADAAAAQGNWAEAVRERLRAVVRDLEERGLLDVRPGRTADEAAVLGGQVLPDVAADLRTAARVFDDVWYGGRTATADSDAQLRAVDDAVRAARPRQPVPR